MIAEAIERDVERFNNLKSERRHGRTFRCQRNSVSSLAVVQVDDDGKTIEYSDVVGIHRGSKTRVWRGRGETWFEIEHDWNQATVACDLTVDGEVLSVAQISQRALCHLLFGP